MSADSSSDGTNSCYITATQKESLFADSFRSLDLPPGYLHMKPSSILASPRVHSARHYTHSVVAEFDAASSSVSCRFYDDFSFVDSSDCETGSETQLLVDRSTRQQLHHLSAPPTKLKPPPARPSSGEKGVRPMTPSRRRRSHFHVHRRSLWNDDFDPFMAALKNVRDGEGKDRAGGSGSHRRAWSDSINHIGPRPSETTKAGRSLRWLTSMPRARSPNPSPIPSPSGPIKSPQPKGVMYARHTRLVKMGRDEEDEEVSTMMDAASCRCGSKREIMKHLMRGRTAVEKEAAAAAAEEEEEEKKKEEEQQQPKLSRRKRLMRRLSFNRSRNGDVEEDKRGSEGRKMVQCKSSLLVCVGIKNRVYAGC